MEHGPFRCTECHKEFATKSNLRRHIENPNIHNKPYERIRNRQHWNDLGRKAPSRRELSERMRKWRAENAEKNKDNDTRCRVYQLAKVKFGPDSSSQKQAWIQEEIDKRVNKRKLRGKQMNSSQYSDSEPSPSPTPSENALNLALTPLPSNKSSGIRLPAISELLHPMTHTSEMQVRLRPISSGTSSYHSSPHQPLASVALSRKFDSSEREYGHSLRQKLELLHNSSIPKNDASSRYFHLHTSNRFCLDVLGHAKLPV
ncbi:hypothetical protein K7432_010646 [Basidiobolus ranarum]|uniref:C2H2-type domain-containing protein n=1 Tax=Basidiobolus ranarum TaxID=34480 RepID=A0ABR2WNH8_9FUNG